MNSKIFNMRTEQLTICFRIISEAEGDVGIPLNRFSPLVVFYITDRSKAVVLVWFSVIACFGISVCSGFNFYVSR